ncbi:MAG: DinB family protein [Candidatus Marsarchaeota archaeon]|nr:DinB family protein [Candidatus Marsarchaeota archaeon]
MLSYNDLFDYFKRERAKLFEALGNMTNDEFIKNRELSFNSIKDVLVHTIIVEDNWLHYRAQGSKTDSPKKFDEFKTLGDVINYAREVDAKTNSFFSRIKEEDLSRKIERVYPDGRRMVYTLNQVLYQVPIEVIHHYGEIFAEFWKANQDAPYYSYLAFSKDTNKP